MLFDKLKIDFGVGFWTKLGNLIKGLETLFVELKTAPMFTTIFTSDIATY